MKFTYSKLLFLSVILPILFFQFNLARAQLPTQDWYFDQEGFKSNQNNHFGMGEESVNLFNGNLILSYTDLHLPGNCGNDLVIQRTYNSKIVKWFGSVKLGIAPSWVGLGWTLHMGRLYNFQYTSSENPILEMPDGSRHVFVKDVRSSSNYAYVSKDNWTGEIKLISNASTIFTPDGTRLLFWRPPSSSEPLDEESVPFLPLYSISHPNGCNPIWIYYDQYHQSRRNISHIQIGGAPQPPSSPPGANDIIFDVSSNYDRLEKIIYKDVNGNDAEIVYSVGEISKLLGTVTPPVGPQVTYTYHNVEAPFFELKTVINPFGGETEYAYETHQPYIGDGNYFCNPYTRVITSKTYSGSDIVDGGPGSMQWLYTYPTASDTHHIEVTDPEDNLSKHYFYGIGQDIGLLRYQIGLNHKNEFFENGSTTLVKEEYTEWQYSPMCELGVNCTTYHEEPPVNDCDADMGLCYVHIPQVQSKRVTLHSTTTSKYYDVIYENYDQFGNVTEVRETLFGGVDKKRTVYEYVWQQANDIDGEFVQANIVSHILKKEVFDEVSSTLVHSLENEYYLGFMWYPSYPIICKFGKIKTGKIDPLGLQLTSDYAYYDQDDNADDGMLYQLTDPRTKIWEYAWQNTGLQSITTPEGWQKFDRSINQYTGLVQTQDDPNNNTTSFTYDTLGRLTRITYPIENDVVMSYNVESDEFDNVTTTRGTSEVIEYFDDLGRVKKIRKKGKHPSTYSYVFYEYDVMGRKSFESEPTFLSSCSFCPGTTYLYDALGRVTLMTTPDGPYSYSYDCDTTTITNPNLDDKIITKDPFGNILQVIDELGNQYDFSYDALDNLTAIDGPGTNDRSFDYDDAGRLESETHPESGQTTYELDDNGNITRKTFQDTTYLQKTYDDNNRLEQKYFSKDALTIDFTYNDINTSLNLVGQLNRQTFPEGYIEYKEYDDLGKVLEVEYSYPVGDYTIEYTYDDNSNNKTLRYPGLPTFVQVNSYDAGNRVKSITDYADAIEYNPAGGIQAINFDNNVDTTIPTDPSLRNRPQYIRVANGLTTLMKSEYEYDSMSNVDRVRRSPNTTWDDYIYDDLNRLERVNYVIPTEYVDYTYDLDGNCTDFASTISDHPAWTLAYTDNQISTAGYTYDSNGNLTQYPVAGIGNKTLVYGYENKIVSATLDTNPTVTFNYDGTGKRIKKTESSTATYFIHDQQGNLISEVDHNGDIGTRYVYAGNYLIGKRSDLPSPPRPPGSRAVPAEVSPPGSAEPFTISKSGTSLVFRFEWLSTASAYHIYGSIDEPSMSAGSYSTKFCDLENNSYGTWSTDGSTYCEWTLTDGSLLPGEHFVVIAENVDGEGPYGSQSSGTPRTPDSDGFTPTEFDCDAPTTGRYYYHLDHLGSVRLSTDENGDVVWPGDFDMQNPGNPGPARYLPFGELYNPIQRDYDTIDFQTQLKFTSKEFDSEIQLSYFGARYLEHTRPPRFTSPDPTLSENYDLENPQSFNLYTYSYNDPINKLDPDGFAAHKHEQIIPGGWGGGGPVPTKSTINNMIQGFRNALVRLYRRIIPRTAPKNTPLSNTTGTTTRQQIQQTTGANVARTGNQPGKTIDPATGREVGRFVGDAKGNVMIEPKGGSTVPAGRGGMDTHTLNPNRSNYQRLNPQGHPRNQTPHAHGHREGSGPGMRGQGPSIDSQGNVVPRNSPDAHWPINE